MRLGRVVLILVCVGSSLARAQGVAGSSAEAKVLALEKTFSQASERGDAKTLELLLDSNLLFLADDGTSMDRSQLIKSLKMPSHPARKADGAMIAHVYGESTVVTGLYRTEGLDHGRPSLRRARFVHTWVFQDPTWVCISSATTRIIP